MGTFRRLGREVAAAAVLLTATALTGPAPARADSTSTPRPALGIGAAALGSGWALWDAATVAPRVERQNAEVRAVSWQVGAGVTPSGAPALAVTAGF